MRGGEKLWYNTGIEIKKEETRMKRRLAVRAVSSFCVLALSGMLIAGCMKIVSDNRTPMYDLSAVKAHFSAFGGAYLTVLAALCAACITHGFIKRAPDKSGKHTGYVRVKTVNARAKAAARVSVLVLAFTLIAAGILNGGLYDVFVKAVNICTECIGLG